MWSRLMGFARWEESVVVCRRCHGGRRSGVGVVPHRTGVYRVLSLSVEAFVFPQYFINCRSKIVRITSRIGTTVTTHIFYTLQFFVNANKSDDYRTSSSSRLTTMEYSVLRGRYYNRVCALFILLPCCR